ncbi:MAG: leucine-rich repeat domain-containing protein, partial [Oscillospiraceae bacterium]|nr:leucine-rich repeat domain-containing protein [Oscillospiraceae bacterium]
SGLNLREIQCLSLCTELRSLDLTNNEISDLSPLMNLQKLEKLRISGNQITDLRPLIGLPALRYLEVTGNAVTETSAVGSLAALQTLDLSDNPIGDFSGLKKLSELQSLRLENTGLADADLEQLYGLKKLNRLALERNDGLTAEAMSSLRSALPTCDISFGTLVYTVALGGVDYRTDITELVIENTEMSSIYGLEKFDCLETVRLSRNRIESISAFQNTHSRATIRTLDLGFNQIQDVSPLSALTALESLDLRSNQISSVQSLARLKQLKKLDLSGNPISAEEIEALRAALPECEIVF